MSGGRRMKIMECSSWKDSASHGLWDVSGNGI